MSLARILPERRSSTYLYVTDETGDMQIGIADMEITECITPEYLASRMDEINAFDAVVLDANLSAESVEYAARHCTAPIIADPVSTAKAMRLVPVLDKLWAIKPNIYEAEKLTGEHDPEKAAAALLDKGVKRVFISLGEGGDARGGARQHRAYAARACHRCQYHRRGRRCDLRNCVGGARGHGHCRVRPRCREGGGDNRVLRGREQPGALRGEAEIKPQKAKFLDGGRAIKTCPRQSNPNKEIFGGNTQHGKSRQEDPPHGGRLHHKVGLYPRLYRLGGRHGQHLALPP